MIIQRFCEYIRKTDIIFSFFSFGGGKFFCRKQDDLPSL